MNRLQELLSVARTAQNKIEGLSSQEKNQLEHNWDVEHAYYSNALEGSNIDRKDFEGLAEEAV